MDGRAAKQSCLLTVVSDGVGDAKEDPSSCSNGDKRCGRHNAWRPVGKYIVQGGAV